MKKNLGRILAGSALTLVVAAGAVSYLHSGSNGHSHAGYSLVSDAFASGGGGRHGKRICSSARSDKIESVMGRVESELTFTPTQESAWTAFGTAIREGEVIIDAHCAVLEENGRPETTPEWLARADAFLATGSQVLQVVRPAFDDFYASLDVGQQATIDELARKRGRHHHRRDHDEG